MQGVIFELKENRNYFLEFYMHNINTSNKY